MKHYRFFLFLVIISMFGIGSSCQNVSNDKSEVLKIEVSEFESKITLDSNVQLLDVRTPNEFSEGFIKNAKNIDWNGKSFQKEVILLDKSKPVFLYCLSGGRSSEAANKLKELGFNKIYNLKGGMNAWRNSGKPVETLNINEIVNVKSALSVADFNTTVSSGLVLVDVFAPWCGPCKIMAPYLQQIADEKKDVLKFLKINNDENRELIKFLNVDELPTIIIYKNGKRVFTGIGLIKKDDLLKTINANL